MTKYLFLEYAKCGTCRKARKWLDEHQVNYEARPIIEQNPTYEELKEWIYRSGLPIRKFFNTSGILYKELHLKDKLPTMSEEDQLSLLASEGKLVKRPLLIADNWVLVGFKEEEWKAILLV